MTNFFLKGVELRNPRLTRNPRIWWAYLCWCIQFQMSIHKPYYPRFIRLWALKHYGGQRYSMTWDAVQNWRRIDPSWRLTKEWTPLPWWLGAHAMGVFHKPWDRIAQRFRGHTLGLSHRCEFTDRKEGALYGGQKGAFMDAMLEKFIENISE